MAIVQGERNAGADDLGGKEGRAVRAGHAFRPQGATAHGRELRHPQDGAGIPSEALTAGHGRRGSRQGATKGRRQRRGRRRGGRQKGDMRRHLLPNNSLGHKPPLSMHGFPRQCARNIHYFREPDQLAVDRGIKLRIAVDARALDFGRTYCGNASTRRGR